MSLLLDSLSKIHLVQLLFASSFPPLSKASQLCIAVNTQHLHSFLHWQLHFHCMGFPLSSNLVLCEVLCEQQCCEVVGRGGETDMLQAPVCSLRHETSNEESTHISANSFLVQGSIEV